MHRVIRAVSDSGASLLVVGFGMADANDHASFYCGVDAWHGAEQFRRECENARVATRGSDKPGQQFRRRKSKPLGGMHAAPDLAQKWSFEMYAQHLRARFVRFMLRGDIFGDALAAAANIIRAGSHRGGHQRSGAVTS